MANYSLKQGFKVLLFATTFFCLCLAANCAKSQGKAKQKHFNQKLINCILAMQDFLEIDNK